MLLVKKDTESNKNDIETLREKAQDVKIKNEANIPRDTE